MAVMNTRAAPTSTPLPVVGVPALTSGSGSNNSGAGGMSPSATVPSPVQPIGGMGSPHQAGIGMKPGAQTPSPSLLQVVKQVNIFNKSKIFIL